MEELVEIYLLRNKKCPLLSFGGLQVIDNQSTILYREGKIEPVAPTIKLVETAMPSDDFIRFVASNKNISHQGATLILNEFCNKLLHMDAYDEINLPFTGKFYINAEGNLIFKSTEVPSQFLPDVITEKVIHPAVPHMMVVGDKETTSTEMAAYYSETGVKPKDWWWIWAICLAVIAVALLAFHFKDRKQTIDHGNKQKIEIPQTTDTYFIDKLQ